MKPLVMPFPPSLNSYYRSIRIGQSCRVLISKKGRQYRELVISEVANAILEDAAYQRIFPLESRLELSIELHAPTRRKYDIDNRSKAILDAMEHAGVYLNDEQIDVLILKRGDIIPSGRAVVTIIELPE